MKNLIPDFIYKNFKQESFEGSFESFALFLDMSGFTAITESMMQHGKEGAEIISNIIDKYFNQVSKIINNYGGSIINYPGDAVTAFFENGDAKSILKCAQDIQYIFSINEIQSTKFGDFNFYSKIGISFGTVQWQIIKHDKYYYYFRGNAIDNASNCEKKCGENEIVVDEIFLDKFDGDITIFDPFDNGFYKVQINSDYLVQKFEGNIPVVENYDKETISGFISVEFTENIIKDEFRFVASVFLSFDGSCSNEVLSELIKCVSFNNKRYHGYLKDIDISDKGGVMLIVFGAPISDEKIIDNSLYFCLSLKESLLKENIDNFRFGVSFGQVFAGFVGGSKFKQYSVYGESVNLAARLMQFGNNNEILVTPSVYSKTQSLFNFESRGFVSFKGFINDIEVYHLLSFKDRFHNDEIYTGTFIGRDQEILFLKNNLSGLSEGKSTGVLYVYGEPGIGKSRLLEECKKSFLESYNILWFSGICDNLVKSALNPVKDFLKNYFKQSSSLDENQNLQKFIEIYELILSWVPSTEPELKENLNKYRSFISSLLDLKNNDSFFDDTDPKFRMEYTFFALKNFIIAQTFIQPVVIEIDDIQFIDSDSVDFLKYLVNECKELPFCLVFLSRYLDNGERFKINFDSSINCSELELNSLGPVASQLLVEDITKNKISSKTADYLYNLTSGNPFYIEQFTLEFLHRKIFYNNNDLIEIDEKRTKEVPSSINSLIISRFDRLASQIKETIQTASVLGREFDAIVLSEMLKNSDELNKNLSIIENQKILYHANELKYIFKHILLRDSVYDMILKSKLRDLHQLAAESIETIFKDKISNYYYDLAFHYDSAENIDKAIEYISKAANKAKSEYSNEKALSYFKRLVELLQKKGLDEEIIRTFLKMNDIYLLTGQVSLAVKIIDMASDLAEEDKSKLLKFMCNTEKGYHFILKGMYDNAEELLINSYNYFHISKDHENISRVCGHLGKLYYEIGKIQSSQKFIHEKFDISEKLNDKYNISISAGNLGIIFMELRDYDNAMKYLNMKLSISEKIGDRRGTASAVSNIGIIHKNLGEYEKAIMCYNRKLKISNEISDRVGSANALTNLGIIYYQMKSFEKAINNLEKSLVIFNELGNASYIINPLVSLSLVYKDLNNFELSVKYSDVAIEKALKQNSESTKSWVFNSKSLVLHAFNKLEEALECSSLALKNSDLIDDKVILIDSTIQYAKLVAYNDFSKAIDILIDLLSKTEITEKKAEIYLETFSLYIKFNQNDNEVEYKDKALLIYKELYSHTKIADYKEKIQFLENN